MNFTSKERMKQVKSKPRVLWFPEFSDGQRLSVSFLTKSDAQKFAKSWPLSFTGKILKFVEVIK